MVEEKKTEDKKLSTKELELSKDTILYLIYLLYKVNFITRRHIQQIFKEIQKKDVPADLAKYLMEEAVKAS